MAGDVLGRLHSQRAWKCCFRSTIDHHPQHVDASRSDHIRQFAATSVLLRFRRPAMQWRLGHSQDDQSVVHQSRFEPLYEFELSECGHFHQRRSRWVEKTRRRLSHPWIDFRVENSSHRSFLIVGRCCGVCRCTGCIFRCSVSGESRERSRWYVFSSSSGTNGIENKCPKVLIRLFSCQMI